MAKRMIIMLLFVAVLFGAIFGFKLFQAKMIGEYFANYKAPPVVVEAGESRRVSWNPYLTAIGTLSSLKGVDLGVEVDGVVNGIHFVSGEPVSSGDLLLTLDDSIEQANLKSYEAQLKLAKLNYDRDQQLIEKNLISRDQFDISEAEYESAMALTEQTRATIAKKKLKAPFAGNMGIVQVDLGEFVKSGTSIGSLQSLDELHLDFNLPEKDLPKLKAGQRIEFTVDAYQDRVFEARLIAIDSRVDPNTRTIAARALVNNSDHSLIPGMFAETSLVIEPAVEYIAVPETAVTYSLYGEEVYLLVPGDGENLVAQRKTVTSGQTKDGLISVTGLDAGVLVATDGQIKLSNGAEVTIAESQE